MEGRREPGAHDPHHAVRPELILAPGRAQAHRHFDREECATALGPLVDALLAGLVRAFPLADLFWEETVRSTVASGNQAPALTRRRGLQLRLVDRRRAATSSTTDFSPAGLCRAFDELHSGVETPRSVPGWPVVALGLPASPAELADWRDWARRLAARASGPGDAKAARCTVAVERFVRGAAPKPGALRVWHGGRILVTLELDRPDCRSSSQQLCSGTSDRRRCERALLDALAAGGARRARPLNGVVPVVLAPGSGAVVMHEIVGHALEADRVLTGASPLSGCRPGELLSHEELTVSDSPAAAWGPGDVEIDDEGHPGREVPLLEKGRLAGLLHDRATALVDGSPPTGNGRRASFETEPSPRMRNLVVAAGSAEPRALLSGIRRGLYLERVSGSVDPSTRSFELLVETGRLIERGACGDRVRGLRVRGATLGALRGVQGVGNDVRVSWEPVWCGKVGTVITGVAGPTILMGPLEVVS